MRFALTHPLVHGPYDPALATGAGVQALARAAEEAGFDGYGFTDHPAPPRRWLDAGGHDALDPFVALGFVAAATTTIRLVPNVVVLPYRNPFVVAKASATLDVLSGGRFTLSVGAGYLRAEFAALGLDVDERNDRFDEALEVLRAAWSGDDVTYEGRSTTAREVAPRPVPTAAPRLPIWIGGNGARARRRVAAHGDGWAPFPAPAGLARTARTTALDTTDALAEAIADLHVRLDEAGRDPAAVDISFGCHAGGDPASDAFDPEAHRAGLEELAALGVTWVQVGVPGDGVDAAVAVIRRYGETVIAPSRVDRPGGEGT
ncbi:LLM class F420-dependent oxidoreductase [Dermatobacter hominis]|uniref:LLM class F420-dependent oxidoreductase n=1 Tax=Dermatobacter hominis TaxID=2884263 RepID=UPI001D106EE2|nr:LLM class F420-dependent oxidoreductase [Dermatobacter hominis]UDY35043.1 LLM class F420-dependent oxidoreductase [Dermatobacter hominis]